MPGKSINNDHLIIESQYFGCIYYIKTLFQFSNAKIDVYENYQKLSFRNRCVVAGSNGLIHLSVPLVKGRSQRQPVKDVRISYTQSWQKQHFRTIESCYNLSPFFEYYRDWLANFYEQKFVFLADMNMEILHWLSRQLKLPATITTTDQFLPFYPEAFDLRGHFMPKNFQSLSGRKAVINYSQVFSDRIGFQENLSVLDLLFCCGPSAAGLLSGPVFSY
jgi:hypothetical protein